jgi:hypothetical protein
MLSAYCELAHGADAVFRWPSFVYGNRQGMSALFPLKLRLASLQRDLTASRRALSSDVRNLSQEANMKALTVAVALVAAGFSTPAFADGPVARNPTERPDGGVRARFESLDRNKDQQLSKVEARADPALAARFGAVDANGDGYLTEVEFAGSLRNSSHPEPIER